MASSTCSCILLLLAFVAYDQSFVEAACPLAKGEAEKEVVRCLSSAGLDGMKSGGGMPNWVEFKKQCSDGSFNQALDCVKRIFDECLMNGNITKALNKVISIENQRRGLDYICDNVDVLVKNQACFGDAVQPIGACVKTETTKFQSEVQARSQSGQQLTEDDIWETTCGLLDGISACQQTVFKEACNDKVAEVISIFSQSARAPVCGSTVNSSTLQPFNSSPSFNGSPSSNGSPSNGSPSFNGSPSIKLVFSALFLLIVFHFKS